MTPIRVLVVDDSVVARRLIAEVLGEDPAITVVGTASNGKLALARLAQTPPDAITLDVEMPELDGLATLAAIRRTHPKLPVIMCSTLTQRAAAATIEALTLGASDYVTKPDGAGGLTVARERLRAELIPKIKALCNHAPVVAARPTTIAMAALRRPDELGSAIRAVAIGVSTGGPPALHAILPALPRDLGVPVVIVQHMPPVFTASLAKRLAGACAMPVAEARGGEAIEPGTIWIAPGDHHLVVEKQARGPVLRTHQGPPECSCRPSVDVMFRSAADVWGGGVLGVILTGMGQDGLRGCEALRAQGAQILVQDAATSVVWGMPGAVARAGLAAKVLPLGEIAGEIVRRVRGGRDHARVAAVGAR